MQCTLESIYQEFDTRLRRFVAARVADPEAADDILQDVYLRIHRHIDTLRDCSRLQAWVYQILRNAIVDYYRVRRAADRIPETLPLPDDACAGNAECELAGSLGSLIEELPPIYSENAHHRRTVCTSRYCFYRV